MLEYRHEFIAPMIGQSGEKLLEPGLPHPHRSFGQILQETDTFRRKTTEIKDHQIEINLFILT